MLTEPIKCRVCDAVSVNGGWIACCGCYTKVAVATRKEVAMVMDEVCPHRKVMGMPVARWTCGQCMYQLWKSLTEGEMPKGML